MSDPAGDKLRKKSKKKSRKSNLERKPSTLLASPVVSNGLSAPSTERRKSSKSKKSKRKDSLQSKKSTRHSSKSKTTKSKKSVSISDAPDVIIAEPDTEASTIRETSISDVPKYYQILGIAVTASFPEINDGFHSAMTISKPEQQKDLMQAFDTLRDPWLRRLYDTLGDELYVEHEMNVEFMMQAITVGFPVTIEANSSATNRRMSLFRKKRTSSSGVYIWADANLKQLFKGPSKTAKSSQCTVVNFKDISEIVAVASLDPKTDKPYVMICTSADETAMVLTCETFEHALNLRLQLLLIVSHLFENLEWVCDCYGI